MKNYTLKKEHPTHFELHDADDGKTFSVAKAGLSKDMLSKIKAFAKVQGFPDGGVVESPDMFDQAMGDVPRETNPNVPGPMEPGATVTQSPVTGAAEPAAPKPSNPDEAVVQALPTKLEAHAAVPAVSPATRVFGPGATKPEEKKDDFAKQYKENLNKEVGGIWGAAKAQSQGATEQANIYRDQQVDAQEVMNNYEIQKGLLDAEHDQITQDVANYKIDPNRYWNSKTTGQKIQSRIALALSGFGSGLTGGPNVVAQLIQKEMDNDIESQKAELGKKENLLSANFKKYGNLQSAMQATMLQQNAIAQGQIAAAAAKTNSQVVQQNAQAAIAQLKNQALPMQQKLATEQALQGQSGPGQVENRIRLMVPEDKQPEVFKQLQEAQKLIKLQAMANDAFDKVVSREGISNDIPGTQAYKQVQALIEPIAQDLAKDSTGKVNETTVKAIKTLFATGLRNNEETIKLKREQLNKLISQNMNFPLLKAYGINPVNNYGSSGDTAIKEAPAKGK